ncbi:MAG: class I adenylate-forming enzyme family protein [Myxococcota bacterium]|nr:class I adenylate-forming enzyme family protein [Myxococcota bacterium]
MTMLPNPLMSSCLARPDHPALKCGNTEQTFRELTLHVRSLASSYLARGVEPGSRVLLLIEEPCGWIHHFLALRWLGAVPFLLRPNLDLSVLESVFLETGALVAVTDQEELSKRPNVILNSNLILSEELAEERFWLLEEPALALRTSGSSGKPQWHHLSVGQLFFSAMGMMIRLGHAPCDRWYVALPLNFVAGVSMLFRAIWMGVTIEVGLPFTPKGFREAIESSGVSLVSMVPTMLEKVLCAFPNWSPPDSLRAVLVGGDACAHSLLARAEKSHWPVVTTWGMTECASHIATGKPGENSAETWVGPVQPFARVEEENGRLVVSGPITADGRMETSDFGLVEEGSRVKIQGRVGDMFISGGMNVFPRMVERVAEKSCSVRKAVVMDIPHPYWGARPILFVEYVEGDFALQDLVQLRTDLLTHLNQAECPDWLVLVKALPETPRNKVDRQCLRNWFAGSGLFKKFVLLQSDEEFIRYRSGLKCFEGYDGVNQLAGAPELVIFTENFIEEGKGSFTRGHSINHNFQFFAEAHGGFVIGFGMNQGHSPTLGEDISKMGLFGGEEIFKGCMAIFVGSSKEGDTRSVNFIESNSHSRFETHGRSQVNNASKGEQL